MSSAQRVEPAVVVHDVPAPPGRAAGRVSAADGWSGTPVGDAGRIAASGGTAAAGRNAAVQCLRGLAAVFVMLYHASFYATHVLAGDPGWAGMFDGRLGLVGVAVFFAISGMLMADLVQRSDPWRFLGHRMVRIYPAFLAAVAVTVPITAWVGGYKPSLHLFSLLLVPAGERIYYLGTEWTLVFECTYYVALFVIAALRWHRHLTVIAAVWLVVIVAAPLWIGRDDAQFAKFYSLWFVPVNAAFAGGLLIPWLARAVPIPLGTGILATVVLMVALPGDAVLNRWAAGAAAVLLVVDAIRLKVPRSAVSGLYMLGEWSYALYLLHVPVLATVYRLWPAQAGAGAAFLCAVGASLILSAGFGMLDVAVYHRLRRAVNDLSDGACRWRVNLYVGAFVAASVAGVVIG